jgi:hypothetical protein
MDSHLTIYKAGKANRIKAQAAQNHVNDHTQFAEDRDEKYSTRKDSGLGVSNRLKPQHGTTPPLRQHGKKVETIAISSDGSSSDAESDEQVLPHADVSVKGKLAHGAQKHGADLHGQTGQEFAPQQMPRSSLKRPLGNLDGERAQSNKKVRFLTPSSERRLKETKPVAEIVTQSTPEEGPVKKGKLGGTLRLASIATPSITQTTQPKVQTSAPLHGSAAMGTHRAERTLSGHAAYMELIGKQPPTEIVKVDLDAAAHSIINHRSGEKEEQLNNQETRSPSESDVEHRNQQTGNVVEEEAVLQKRRAKAEREARKRWEKRAAEKRAKGEDPEEFTFVYKPTGRRGPYKKKNPSSEKQDTAPSAKKEKKPRTPKRMKNAVFESIKRVSHGIISKGRTNKLISSRTFIRLLQTEARYSATAKSSKSRRAAPPKMNLSMVEIYRWKMSRMLQIHKLRKWTCGIRSVKRIW